MARAKENLFCKGTLSYLKLYVSAMYNILVISSIMLNTAITTEISLEQGTD